MTTHWKDVPIHVVDFEGSLRTGVVEFGVATLLGGEVVATTTSLCRPKGSIPPEQTLLHGIADADARRFAPFADQMERFFSMRESGPICAHNATFERHLLKAAWPYPRKAPDFARPGRSCADWGPMLDTLRLYEALYPTLANHSLGALVELFGLRGRLDALAAAHCPPERRTWHCALFDALGSALLLIHAGELPGFEGMSLEWLLEHSQSGGEAAQGELFG